MLLGQLQDPEGVGRREAVRGGLVQHRVGEEGLGLVVAQQGFEGLGGGALAVARDADQLRAVQAQIAEHGVVAWVVHQDAVAGLDQVARGDVQGLGRAVGQHDLLRSGADPEFGEARLEQAAQRQIAQGRAVVGDRGGGD